MDIGLKVLWNGHRNGLICTVAWVWPMMHKRTGKNRSTMENRSTICTMEWTLNDLALLRIHYEMDDDLNVLCMELTLTHLYHGMVIDWFGLNTHVLWSGSFVLWNEHWLIYTVAWVQPGMRKNMDSGYDLSNLNVYLWFAHTLIYTKKKGKNRRQLGHIHCAKISTMEWTLTGLA